MTVRLLRSLVETGANYKVVLVDDSSEPPLVPGGIFEGLHLRVLRHEVSRGPAVARNTGLWETETPYVAFTDNDVEVTSDWMEALVAHMEAAPEDVAGVGGRVVAGGGGLVGEYHTRLHLLDPFVHKGRVVYLVTANCLFRRRALLDVGGFDGRFRVPGGEDPEVCFRLLKAGWTLEAELTATVRHHYSRSIRSFTRTFFRYGRGCRKAMAVLAADQE